MDISENLKKLRLKKGLSQAKIAKTLGLKSSNAYSHWELGKASPSLRDLERIAIALDTTVSILLFGENENKSPDEIISLKTPTTISERIAEFLKAKNINASQLSKMLGDTSQKYYKILSNKSSPQYDTLESILKAFPDLSAEWLMRGNGQMLISGTGQNENKDEIILALKLLLKESL